MQHGLTRSLLCWKSCLKRLQPVLCLKTLQCRYRLMPQAKLSWRMLSTGFPCKFIEPCKVEPSKDNPT